MVKHPHRSRRRRYSQAEREAAFVAADGICHLCRMAIAPGEVWQMSHIDIPLEFGGLEVGPAHILCHARETATHTAPTIAKARRERRKHIGAFETATKLPCGHSSHWKKKIGGGVEPRASLAEQEQARRARSPFLDLVTPPLMRQIANTPTGET